MQAAFIRPNDPFDAWTGKFAAVVDGSWECRVTYSRGRSKLTDDTVNVLVEHSYEDLRMFDQSAEILVGETVKRIERVDDRSLRQRVPGVAYLVLRGITVENVPIGAVIRGPVP